MWKEHAEFLFQALVRAILWRLVRSDLERENLILLKENQILKRKRGRVVVTRLDRSFYLAVTQISRKLLDKIVVIRPETILSWQKARARRAQDPKSQRMGRPPVSGEIAQLILKMRRANPRWGAQRIMGELKKLGFKTCKATVQRVLREAGYPPSNPKNRGLSWKGFIQNHGKRLFACDFFTVDTMFLEKLHVFFLIDVQTRAIELIRVKKRPNAPWLKTLFRSHFAFAQVQPEILISDRDALFKHWLKPFLEENYGIELRQTPPRRPVFNAYAERMVRTFREEVLDHVVVFGESDLQRVLNEYVEYYNRSRAHSSLDFRPPRHDTSEETPGGRAQAMSTKIEPVRVLDGLITNFKRIA